MNSCGKGDTEQRLHCKGNMPGGIPSFKSLYHKLVMADPERIHPRNKSLGIVMENSEMDGKAAPAPGGREGRRR